MAINTLAATGLNIVLNVLLIYRYDYTGAAFASAASYLLLALLNALLLYRTISFSLKEQSFKPEDMRQT